MHAMAVKGVDLDPETRCRHYHGPTDVVALKFKCCGEYYACKDCHAELADHAPVNDTTLRNLAQQRAQAVQQYFNGKVDSSRVFVVAPKLDAKGIEDKGATTRVDFGLK